MNELTILFTVLGIIIAIVVGAWQIYLAQKQVQQGKENKIHRTAGLGQSQRLPTLPDVEYAQHPALWIPTNHSKSIIDYELVRDGAIKAEIAEVLERYYSAHVGRAYRVDSVNEISGTLNYRVKGCRKKPILLRFHKSVASDSALATLQSIQRHIFESGVFSDSPLNECLVPLSSISGATYERFKSKLIEVYPFAEAVTHYSGESLTQVETLAEKYGLVQKALRDLGPLDLGQLSNLRPYMTWFERDESRFDLICQINDKIIKGPDPDRFSLLFAEYQDFLKKAWREVKPYLAEIKTQSEPLLHDFHPHNTFFRSERCVLIYDYEATSRNWSESDALAFTIHRFIREYIRSLRQHGHTNAEAEISRVVDTFLEHYSLAGMSVPPDFKANLGVEIKRINLAKLLQVMSNAYNLLNDPARRDEDIWYTGLVKFISYLKEADRFNIQRADT